MNKTMTEVCDYLNNYFWESKMSATFKIEGGHITLPGIKKGQYIRIVGSTFNDGVHNYPGSHLTDETFKGQIWAMAVPGTVVALVQEIEAWQDKHGKADSDAMSPFNSESFAGYSYSKSGTGNGAVAGWQDVYAARLKPYRRLRGAT